MFTFEDVLKRAMELRATKTNPDANAVKVTDAQVMFEALIELLGKEVPAQKKGPSDNHVTVATYKKLVNRVEKLEKAQEAE